ncbi:MAG: 6-carboxytetrahydropterin synthase [Bacteroidota bacterium]
MNIRITKEFRFEMAHALLGYDGPCKDIHGHSYRLLITLKGKISTSEGPKNGMLFDFSELRNIVQDCIIKRFDHALVLNENTSKELLHSLQHNKLLALAFQPTCEQLCAYFANLLDAELPQNVRLHHVTLYETATSFAEWYAEDNPNSAHE